MSIIIRDLEAEDRNEWTSLWRAYLAFYETSLPETVFDTTFKRLLSDDHKNQNCMIALIGSKPVGLVHYIYHPHNWNLNEVTYLQDLYADPDHRGQGIGRALIQAVYDKADANGTPNVYWLTQEFNHTARHLYDRVAKVTPFIKYNR